MTGIPHEVRTLLDALYAKLDEPPKPLEDFRLRPLKEIPRLTLPAPADPDPDYPWLSRKSVARIKAMEEEYQDSWSAKFQVAYGFEWWAGPKGGSDGG